MTALICLGSAYADLGDVQRAIGYCEQSSTIARELGNADGVAANSFIMAMLYSQRGEADRALSLAQESAQIWTQIESPKAQHAQQLIAQLQSDALQANLIGQALENFMDADSLQLMYKVATQNPMLRDTQFIQLIEKIIREQVPLESRPAFELRLIWLKWITSQ